MTEMALDAGEVRRAQYTILVNAACCLVWAVLNAAAAFVLHAPRLLGLSGAALAMIACWWVALRDLKTNRVRRGVLNYVTSGLVLLLVMSLSVPELSILFVFATFIFLAFGLSYAGARISAGVVTLTLVVAGAMLFTSLVLEWTSGVDSTVLRWVNIIGMTMALAIDATSFVALRKTLEARAERLARAEQRYHLLLENARDAIAVLTNDGVILEANRACEQMMNRPREEVVGRNIADFADEGSPATLTRGDGKKVRVELSRTVVDVGRERFVLAIGRDVTERLRLEEQLRQSQKMDAVGRLAGGVAHDFNNLLSVILSYSEMLLGDMKPGAPMREDLAEIRKAGQRAADLTRQLLMFSRQQVLEPKVLDLNEVLASMDKMLQRILGADVHLVSLPSRPLGRVRVDPSSVEQVIMNLVVNARDAMPTGGQLTMETANVDLDEGYAQEHLGVTPGPHVMLAVTDTGSGMDKATLARIFEPFFTTKGSGKGTGLGLSTVFGIVEQSRGSVWVYSEVGKGTAFKIYFPRIDAAVEPIRPMEALTPGRGSETILLVEDDDQVRAVACGILAKSGYQVVEARNAAQALAISEKHPGVIHLLVTDVVMPQMSGPELAKRLTASRPDVRVLCMSGYTDDSIVRHGVLEAHLAYLQKPITPETLTTKVREVLHAPKG
jgi:two-component system cell cycle sensor histidine kinase/response regulator CckA